MERAILNGLCRLLFASRREISMEFPQGHKRDNGHRKLGLLRKCFVSCGTDLFPIYSVETQKYTKKIKVNKYTRQSYADFVSLVVDNSDQFKACITFVSFWIYLH